MAGQSLDLKSFEGGITENFIDAPLSRYESADNFVITVNKKLTTRDGSVLLNSAYPILPTGNQRIGLAIPFQNSLVLQSGKNFYYDDGVSWQPIVGPIGTPLLNTASVNNVVSATVWNNQLYVLSDNYNKMQKVYIDGSNVWQARTAGLPNMASPTVTSTAGTDNYIYAFHYYYEYYVGTVLNIDAGRVIQKAIVGVAQPNISNIVITNIPTLVNGVDDNYETSAIKIKIYRTVANGTTLFSVGQVANGVTTFTDNIADTAISSNGTIYTTGGVLDNDAPPLSKTIHTVNGVCYYGNIKLSNGEIRGNRLAQSVLNDIDSVPLTNTLDFPDDIVSINSYIDRVIVICKNSTFRLEGLYDELGGSGISTQRISTTIGGISDLSAVETPVGLFFAAAQGFAYTDGFKCIIISQGLNSIYKTFTQTAQQRRRISATYDKVNGRVYWSVQSNTGSSTDVNEIYVLDTRWGVSPDMSFTKFNGTTDNFSPTATTFFNKEFIRCDRRGYVFVHKAGQLSDPRVDINNLTPSTWGTTHIPYLFKTGAIKPVEKYRSFIPKILLTAKNVSNLSLQIGSDSDIGNRKRTMKPIRWRSGIIWGDPTFTWGGPAFRWGVQGFIEQQRYFHSDDLRCTYKQISLQPAEVVIVASKHLGVASVVDTSTVVLDSPTLQFSGDYVEYLIYFAEDNYTRGYIITANTATTLTVTSGELIVGGAKQWEIRGKPKDEVFSLISLSLLVSPLGQTQDFYTPASVGGNS